MKVSIEPIDLALELRRLYEAMNGAENPYVAQSLVRDYADSLADTLSQSGDPFDRGSFLEIAGTAVDDYEPGDAAL